MNLTYCEHPSFVKVVNDSGDTLARCDKLEDSTKWRLSFYMSGRRVERLVDPKDAARLVKAVAVMVRPN